MTQDAIVWHRRIVRGGATMPTTLDAVSWHHHDDADNIPESSPLSYS